MFWHQAILGMVIMASIFDVFLAKNETRAANIKVVQSLKAEPDRLRAHVTSVTKTSVPRDYAHLKGLEEAADYIRRTWQKEGLEVRTQLFTAEGKEYKNILTSLGPTGAPRIVVGAHYDVAGPNPGADDNASGIAGILELARLLKTEESKLKYRIDLVAFCLEEPPFFATSEMGSYVYASSLKKENVKVSLMLSLEMIGFFSEQEGSQEFPLPALKHIYPNKGNFIGVVGDLGSLMLAKKVKGLMAEGSNVGVEFIAAPRSVPGIDLSDHRSFWEHGYPALMITDTAFFRNRNYHTSQDTVEKLNFQKMAEVVDSVAHVARNF